MNILMTYNKTTIAFNDSNLINLTHMWKAVDGTASQKPAQWLNQREDGKNFLKSLQKKLDVRKTYLVKTIRGGRGGGGGTYAHWQVALAYAKYLSPEFHIKCNEIIRQHFEYEAHPEKALSDYQEKCIEKWRAEGKSEVPECITEKEIQWSF